MTEVFRVTDQMEKELESEIATLANDTPREIFGVPRISRRNDRSVDRRSVASQSGDDREAAATAEPDATDPVAHPAHYTSHPSGVECITVTEWMSFNLGNAVKYIWRAGLKGYQLDDLRKARWYVDREIKRLGGE